MKLDKNTVLDLTSRKVEKILIFFYDAWCSWTKINIKEDFEINDDLEKLDLSSSPFLVYVEKKDKDKFKGAIITKTVTADHTWKEKIRYIFSNDEVKERCGCGSSFSFEKKEPIIDLKKLQDLKNNFKK
jgi:Fe-S cluster assembly iron-binding protein IscA